MGISFNASVSGVSAAFFRQDVSANNISNINTPGFEQSTAYQTDMAPQGTRISSLARTPNPDRATSNTDLAKEVGELKTNKAALQADLRVMKVQNSMLKSVLDIFA
jgi:flagellar hook protein FlgE